MKKFSLQLSQLDASIEGFSIRQSGFESNCTFNGILQTHDGEIVLKINKGFEQLVKLLFSPMDIHFTSNRTTFQLQHQTLGWMQKHKLYDILIENPSHHVENRAPSIHSKFKLR